MQQIADWLEKLGLAEYAQRFADNDIDFTILGDLTDQDLEKIGVASLGHRRKLLRAIANLQAVEKSAPVIAVAAPAAAMLPDTAERRQVTVMFSDLVGSTALSARMDPEDLREIIAAYHKCVAETVHRFDGFVAQYLGDGVLVYFGYPQAHEDDAERAVRAGLELSAAVSGLKTRAALQARVGIASGLVVVGDLMDSGNAPERGIVGETPNLAARLQAIAEPSMVVIAESTRKFLGTLFELQDLGPREVKGIAGPVRAWAALRARLVESRFEALHASGLTDLVGREEEFELLLRRWGKAKAGEGQVALLCGEAGIGKSRLTAALLERLAAQPHTRLRYFCSPQHTDSALYPIIGQMERAAGLARDDTTQTRLDKLDAVLASASTTKGDATLIAEMLSLPNDGRYPPLELNPQQRRERTVDALLAQIQGLARTNPVLMILEDAHWIDPTSLEVFSRAVERIAGLGVLLVVTFRPEFQPPWVGLPHVAFCLLNRLAQRESLALIQRLVRDKNLPREIVDQIVARTDGIPLFIEELTKTVLESGLLEERPHEYVLRGPLPALAIPSSLQGSLMARLDRLATVKDIAQIGATIGRDFSYELLAPLASIDDAELQAALDRLSDSGLIICHGAPPHATYSFKHALVQDAAYASLLRNRRQQLHGRIAQLLVDRFPETIDTQPELIARHFAEAGLDKQAAAYWQRAGERATKRSANFEAVEHFRHGLAAVEALSDRAAHATQELLLLIGLGAALMMTRTSAAPEIAHTYARARQLAHETGRTNELSPALWGSWGAAFAAGDMSNARILVDELFDLAHGQGDDGVLLQAHHAAWTTLLAAGDLGATRSQIEAGLKLYRREAHGHHAHIYGGHDPNVCGYALGSLTELMLGYPDRAIQHKNASLAAARELAHPFTVAHSLWFAAELHQLRGEPRYVEELTAGLLPLVAEHGSSVGVANAKMLRGWALAAQERVDEGLAAMQSGLAAWRATGSRFHVPYRLARAADVHRLAGHFDEGLRLVGEAIEAAERSGDCWFESELHRLRADLLLAGGGSASEGERSYVQAIDIARRQGARLFELRSAMGLAQLWRAQSRRHQARDILAPVYGWFTEGFNAPDLQRAKALLEALA